MLDIPIYIIAYNNVTHVKSMINQLEKYTNNIVILDNKSTFPPMIEYLHSLHGKYSIYYMGGNYGHGVFFEDPIWNNPGDYMIITDPDLELNHNLPSNFIEILLQIC